MSEPQLLNPSGVSGGGEAHRTPEMALLLPALQPLAGPGEEPGTEDEKSAIARPGAWSILLSLLLATVGFVLVAAVIHVALPRTLYLHTDIRSGKLTLMKLMRSSTRSASFGSSHVHNGFDPRAFDRALAGSPLQTHSLNLAIEGGSQTEQRSMALEFVQNIQTEPSTRGEHSRCFVLLELGAGANFTNDHLLHPRAINIYDRANASFVGALTAPGMSRSQSLGRRGYAYIAMALHYMNVGMLSSALLPNLSPDQDYQRETADDRRGLLVLSGSQSPELLAKERSDQPRTGTVSTEALLPGNSVLVHQLMQAQGIHGVQYVYLLMPTFSDLTAYRIYPDTLLVDGQTVPIVNLARPDLFPQLYQLSNWHDDAHLNERGAAVASTLIAQQLETFAAQYPIPACGG